MKFDFYTNLIIDTVFYFKVFIGDWMNNYKLYEQNALVNFALMVILTTLTIWYLLPISYQYLRQLVGIGCMVGFIFIILLRKSLFIHAISLITLLVVFSIVRYHAQWFLINEFLQRMYTVVAFFFPMLLAFYYINDKNKNQIRTINKFAIIILFMTTLTTIIGLESFPMASRDLAMGECENREIYNIYNIGGYAFVYGSILMLPVYFNYMRNNLKLKLISIVMIICTVYCVYKSQFSTAVLFTSFLLFFLMLRLKLNVKICLVILIFIVFFNVFSNNIFSDLLFCLSTVVDSKVISSRLDNLALYIKYGSSEGDLEARQMLYLASLTTFLKSPIIGNLATTHIEQNRIGGHSEILDILGASGIVGFIPFALIIGLYYKRVIVKLKRYKTYEYFRWSLFICFILGLINTLFTSRTIAYVIFFLIPSLIATDYGKRVEAR